MTTCSYGCTRRLPALPPPQHRRRAKRCSAAASRPTRKIRSPARTGACSSSHGPCPAQDGPSAQRAHEQHRGRTARPAPAAEAQAGSAGRSADMGRGVAGRVRRRPAPALPGDRRCRRLLECLGRTPTDPQLSQGGIDVGERTGRQAVIVIRERRPPRMDHVAPAAPR